MNLKKLLVSAIMLSVFSWYSQAQQPYSGCWHPEDIREWSPETDPDAKFNRSTVRLAERFKEPSLIKANQYQFYEGQVCNSTILFKVAVLVRRKMLIISISTTLLIGNIWIRSFIGQGRQEKGLYVLLQLR